MVASSPRAPLAWLLLPLIVGYLLSGILPNQPLLLAAAGTVLIALASACIQSTGTWRQAAWAILACSGGVLLAAGYCQHRLAPPPGWVELPPREAELTIQISRIYPNNGPFLSERGTAVIQTTAPHLRDLLDQKIYFSRSPRPGDENWAVGSRVDVLGILEMLPQGADERTSFEDYLRREGIHFRLTRISLLSPPGNPAFHHVFLAAGHDRFEQALSLGAPEAHPAPGIYRAMLLGKSSELTSEQRRNFLHTGTLHLFAISGLHIGVIALSLHTLLTLLRVPPRPGAVVGLLLLLCFVGITGASPSAVRAFLMVAFFWAARFCGRASNPIAALAGSAFLVLLLYPSQLWSAGFQLSYAVVSGILFLGVPLGKHWQEKWTPYQNLPEAARHWWQNLAVKGVRGFALTLGVSLSATLLSSPLSMLIFGIFAPGAALLNLALIPAASGVIVAGFISVFASFFGLTALSVLLNHAAWVLITLMEKLVEAAPMIPGSFWSASFLSPGWASATIFAVLASLMICSCQRWRGPAFHFVVPFLVFVVLLVSVGRLTFPEL